MSYDPSLAGLGEAARDALVALIRADLGNLNQALNHDGALAPVLMLGAEDVQLGDAERLDGARISVAGGGFHDDTDVAVAECFTGAGFLMTVTTSLHVYIDPRAFAAEGRSAADQAAMEERARQRICDHLRVRLLNTRANNDIVLASREASGGVDADVLKGCHVTAVRLDRTPKSFGKMVDVLSAHLEHVGQLAAIGG